MIADAQLEALLRESIPVALSALVRRYGRFDACEDAMQEASLAAETQWKMDGAPDNPEGWLISVATRRLIEFFRNEAARHRREQSAGMTNLAYGDVELQEDDSLTLLFLCCHPSLSLGSQIALTLRAVGGLTTAEIARAFVVPEATIGQRISRAKQRLRGAPFELPPDTERSERIAGVLHVLYLIFNEGYTASSGQRLHCILHTREAIRLTRLLHKALPNDGEVAGLLALMLLTEARRPARTDAVGVLIPLSTQDRSRWDRSAIAEGIDLITASLSRARVGPYQLQAAIAAIHAEAPSVEETDWQEILGLYDLLNAIAPGPMVTLNRIVASSMVLGPQKGLDLLSELEHEPALSTHHRFHAVRAHLLERIGERNRARLEFETAARLTLNIPEQRYLDEQALRLARERS